MHKGWIYCRDHEDECVDFVTPEGQDSSLKAQQRFMMREVMREVLPLEWASHESFELSLYV